MPDFRGRLDIALDILAMYVREATTLGFTHAASAPLVRSSYHADQQAHGAGVT